MSYTSPVYYTRMSSGQIVMSPVIVPPVSLEMEGLEDFQTFKGTHCRKLTPEEIRRVWQAITFNHLQYKETIQAGGPRQISFQFNFTDLLQTIFDRLYFYGVLRGIYIKGGTNKEIYCEGAKKSKDIDIYIQISDWKNEQELDALILSCFSHVSGITCSQDSPYKRSYWKDDLKIFEMESHTALAPGFGFYHHNCGQFFLKGGLGNYCKIQDSRLYSISAMHNGQKIKFDIHVVKKLDHYSFCSQNSIYTSLHPIFWTHFKGLPLDKVELFAKSNDYPIGIAVDHLRHHCFSYDPLDKVQNLVEGLHIHMRLRAKGNRCLNNDLEKLLFKGFLSQYIEACEVKSKEVLKSPSPSYEYRVKKERLKACLEAELDEHLSDSIQEQLCFLLNVEHFHFTQNTPCFEEIQEIIQELILKVLGETKKKPKDLKPFFHLLKVHAYLFSVFTTGKKSHLSRLEMGLPLFSIQQLFSNSKQALAEFDLFGRFLKHFPLVRTLDFLPFYKQELAKIFPKVTIGVIPPENCNPYHSFENFIAFFSLLKEMGIPERDLTSRLLTLISTKKALFHLLPEHQKDALFDIILKLGDREDVIHRLDEQYLLGSEKRKKETLAFIAKKGGEGTFKKGLGMYRTLSLNERSDPHLLAELMENLLTSIFSARKYKEILGNILFPCNQSEGHFLAHLNCFKKLLATDSIMLLHRDDIWDALKQLCVTYNDRKFSNTAQKSLRLLILQFCKNLSNLKDIKSLVFYSQVIREGFAYPFLEDLLVDCLCKHLLSVLPLFRPDAVQGQDPFAPIEEFVQKISGDKFLETILPSLRNFSSEELATHIRPASHNPLASFRNFVKFLPTLQKFEFPERIKEHLHYLFENKLVEFELLSASEKTAIFSFLSSIKDCDELLEFLDLAHFFHPQLQETIFRKIQEGNRSLFEKGKGLYHKLSFQKDSDPNRCSELMHALLKSPFAKEASGELFEMLIESCSASEAHLRAQSSFFAFFYALYDPKRIWDRLKWLFTIYPEEGSSFAQSIFAEVTGQFIEFVSRSEKVADLIFMSEVLNDGFFYRFLENTLTGSLLAHLEKILTFWKKEQTKGPRLYQTIKEIVSKIPKKDFFKVVYKYLSFLSTEELAALRPECNPLSSFENFLEFYPILKEFETEERISDHLLFLLKTQKVAFALLPYDQRISLLSLIKSLKRNEEILANLDDENLVGEQLKKEAFALIDSGSEKMFIKGVETYRFLLVKKESDPQLCKELMSHLLRSPLASKEKKMLFKLLCDACLLSEEHFKEHKDFLEGIFEMAIRYSSAEEIWRSLMQLCTRYQEETFAVFHPTFKKLLHQFIQYFFIAKGSKEISCQTILQDGLRFKHLQETFLSIADELFTSSRYKDEVLLVLEPPHLFEGKKKEAALALASRNKKMFAKILGIFKDLSLQKKVDVKLLEELGFNLLCSPFAEKEIVSTFKVIADSCLISKEHFLAQKEAFEKAFSLILKIMPKQEIFAILFKLSACYKKEGHAAVQASLKKMLGESFRMALASEDYQEILFAGQIIKQTSSIAFLKQEVETSLLAFLPKLFSFWSQNKEHGQALYASVEEILDLVPIEAFLKEAFSNFSLIRSQDIDSLLSKTRCNPLSSLHDFLQYFPMLQKIVTNENFVMHLSYLLSKEKKVLEQEDREKLINAAHFILKGAKNTKDKNEIIETLDAQYGFRRIDKNPTLKALTFDLIGSKSEKMFQRGLDIYKALLAEEPLDEKLLAEFMDQLFKSNFAIYPKYYIQILKLFTLACTKSETLFLSHVPFIERALSFFSKNALAFDDMWGLLKALCSTYQNEKHTKAQEAISRFVGGFLKLLQIEKGMIGIKYCNKVISEGFSFPFLKDAIMAHLSFHLDRLFKEWKTDPHRALEFLLALKEPFECLPLKEFQEFFLRFISVCPSYDPQIEGFMLSALEKIRSEDEKEAIAVLKVMHDKGITKQYSALDICYRSLIKPEVVKVEKDKPPEEKKEKEAESAASTPKPVEKPVSEQVKENERLLALIKSDKDIESVEDLFFRLFYFSRVNLKDEKSLRFLLRYIPRFLAKIDKFTDGTFALECEQFKILYDVIEKERERIDGLKDELLAGSSSHLYKEYRSCFYCFELTIRRFDLRQKASSYQFPTQIFEDHVKGIKDGILTDEAFLRCWKDLVPLIFTRDKWDHLLNHVMDQEYYDNGIKEEVVCVVQQILIDNLISRMEKTVNAAYLDNAAAEIRALAGSEYLPKSREGTVNIFTAYNSAWKVFRIIIKWFDHEKDDENFWNILEHHATNLIEILNGTHDKEKCALWRAGLSATESDQLGADLANVLKAISKIKKSLDEDEMANEKEKTEQVSKLHGEAWGLWQDYVKEKEASKKASLEPLKKAFSLCSQAFQIKQDQKNVVQLFFIIARELQNWHQLLPFLEKFDEAFPKDADILFDIAKAYEELKEYPKAIAYYSRAFVADPNSKEVQLELAYCLAQNGEKQKAVQFLDRFLKKWPDDLKAHFNRAGYLIDLGQHEKALEDFRAVIDIKAEGEGERRMQGRARMVLEQYGVKKTSHKATDAQKKLKALLQKKKSNRKG